MPLLKIADVVSFSSEDPVNVAENLKYSNPTRKWKCQKPGEKLACAILKLEKASVISSIHIGNECSAFVEILVNRTGSNADYKVLLVMSSFMTPVEARQGINLNKVRMFNAEHLSKPECTEKWDKIMINCTQPFNKHLQYGLSFINFYSPEDKKDDAPQTNFGKFTLRPDSPENSLHIGSLFARRKELQQPQLEVKAVTSIRDAAASLTKPKSPACTIAQKRKLLVNDSPKPKKPNIDDSSTSKDRNRNDILYKNDEDKLSDKMEKAIQQRDKEKGELKAQKALEKKVWEEKQTAKAKDKKKEDTQTPKASHSRQETAKQSNHNSINKDKMENKERKVVQKDSRITKPYEKLLEGVVIVISGIQNPERGDLRTAALQMGAKYKPDWGTEGTHLICAFQNTPKFYEVKGKGKIITKKWVTDCQSQRKRLPWRRYALDPADKKEPESEDEIWEEIQQYIPENEAEIEDDKSSISSTITTTVNRFGDETEYYYGGSDTEDEIERIQLQSKAVTGEETDEEIVEAKRNENTTPDLPNCLRNEIFYIDNEIPDDTKAQLKRYIIALDGKVLSNFTKDVTIIISTEDTSSVLKLINSNVTFVSPSWVWKCYNKQKKVSFESFLL